MENLALPPVTAMRIGDLNVCESKIEWKISSFSALSAKKGDCYESPSFTFSNNSFKFRVYPAGSLFARSGFISVFIFNENGRSCYVPYTLSLKMSDVTVIKTLTRINDNIHNFNGYAEFYERHLLQHDDVTISCTLKLNTDKKQDKLENKEHLHDEKALDLDHGTLKELYELSKNLKNFYANKDSCDVILQLRNKELKAHKAILMARSTVFAAMFQHDTLEKQTGVIAIPDCDPDSFPQFLEYLYCGCLEDVSFNSVYHLYYTSVKYDVQKLKEFCIKYLIGSLTADNVCDTIVLADKYDEMQLLSETQKFFNENFSKIVLTSQWVNLLKNDYCLANKFLIELSKTKDH